MAVEAAKADSEPIDPVSLLENGRNSGEKDTGSAEEVIDHDAEKRVIRKVDFNLITIFGALYMMSFLGIIRPGRASHTSTVD